MLFYLIDQNFSKFLIENVPVVQEVEIIGHHWLLWMCIKYSNFLCKNYDLNGLDSTLHNVYSSIKFTKELWVFKKKFFFVIFILNIFFNKIFQVVTNIKKLHLMWKDFKNYLKHKYKAMNIEKLIVGLRIEEDNMKSDNTIRG